MSREEVSEVLRNLQLSIDGLHREVEASIRRLPQTRTEQLPQLLADCRRRLHDFAADQLQELDEFAREAGLQEPGEGAGGDAGADSESEAATPFAVKLQSLEKRVANMGGIPALGACVLPRMTPGMRPQLSVTASPAALEIMCGRMGADAVPKLKKLGSAAEEAHTPLVQLRSTPQSSSRLGTPTGAAAPNSELAAAIARRMQRISSANSPESARGAMEAAMAAEAADAKEPAGQA